MTSKTPSRSWKLPASWNPVAMPFVLSLLMSCIVSGISTLQTVGFAGDLISKWMAAWAVSWCIAFPSILLILPLARRIVAAIVEPGEPGR